MDFSECHNLLKEFAVNEDKRTRSPAWEHTVYWSHANKWGKTERRIKKNGKPGAHKVGAGSG